MSVSLYGSGNTILQVQQTVINNQITMSGASWNPITGFSVSITPLSTTSKIMVIANSHYSTDASNYDIAFSLYRNSSAITGAQGTASGVRTVCSYSADNRQTYGTSFAGVNYIDSPASTSAQTYAVYVWVNTGTVYLNREQTNGNDAGSMLPISSITVMEISGT